MIVKRFLGAFATLALAVAFGACTAEVEEEGDLPNVEVTDEGSLPEVDVDPADVDVSTDTQTVVTPDVDVNATEGDDP
jgi:hypothetical protein